MKYCNGFRLGVFIVPLAFFSFKGSTGVFGFTVSDPLEAPINIVSKFPPTPVKIKTRQSRSIRDETRWRKDNSRMFAGSNSDNESSPSSPRVKFSSDFGTNKNDDDDSSSSLANPLDQFLTLVASDAFSVAFGLLGLLAVVVHRWNLVVDATPDRATAEALTQQTRQDLVAVLASGSVLLNGVTKLDVTAALAESVVLEGKVLPEPEHLGGNDEKNDGAASTLTWALESLLVATPAKTAILIDDTDDRWTIQCRAGIVPSSVSSLPEKTPILERVGSPENSKETYLPTLQALPGRTELTYLPNNTQMAVLIPIRPSSSSSDDTSSKKNSVLVLGGNTAKSFTPRDIAWSRIVAEKLGEDL
jgi:hypothetical protein